MSYPGCGLIAAGLGTGAAVTTPEFFRLIEIMIPLDTRSNSLHGFIAGRGHVAGMLSRG